ncbi:GDSL esterase/lipase At2g04020 isoform X2 [Amborella trichopoda]|uniref:GDSL esterase/lipase At2g04020 isoform X2 n=1 Tax=Amborella trichopoda TaxID=13333 RepID=UPI0009C1731C|nr:GDSL esterase/lipase At2g04020 isoform X2 [Amborella trichopoda]|eukprot:XP_020522982.1 GDSL esterase/lipase At2g04020 isoform X2 [Amborella trichopoda]
MAMQVEQFIELKNEFRTKLGHSKAQQAFLQAVYYISFGLNHYKALFNHYEPQRSQPKDGLVEIVIGNLSLHIQALDSHGARKFLLSGLKNLGCMAGMRMLNNGECLDEASYLCLSHNVALEELLIGLASKLDGFRYIFFDQFEFFKARTEKPHNYGALANGEKVLLLVFGDSLVDCGTKNYLNTSKEHRANYYPYGRNVFSGEATGRFSDGKVTPDFIAEFVNLPMIPPYLQPDADLSYGANFASGGAGVLSETNRGEVIDMGMQIEQLIQLRKS